MGYGSGTFGMKVNSFYHFRFKFVTKFSTLKFSKAGVEVTNIFTDRDFDELLGHLNWATMWTDSAGGVSTMGFADFLGHCPLHNFLIDVVVDSRHF
jgi:hypothetical protein